MIDVGLDVWRWKSRGQQQWSSVRLLDERGRNEYTNFFSRANASIDLVDNFSADHFVENDPSSRIQYLLVGGSVRLVLEVCILTWAFTVYADTEVVRLVDLRYSGREF